jgi:type II secretory pathway pseudopilin PulG
MVVVIILTTLVAAALPLLAPNSESRRLREAARALQTAITTAQTKATELGRPYGIWLERQSVVSGTPDPRDMGAVLTVHFCEEPPPFAGYSYESSLILTPETSVDPNGHIAAFGRLNAQVAPGQPMRYEMEPLPDALFRPGDRIIVNNLTFQFTAEVPSLNLNRTLEINGQEFLRQDNRYHVTYVGSPGPPLYPGFEPVPDITSFMGRVWTYPRAFQILRQPHKAGDPLQLPAGTTIDLEASGDRSYFYHDPLREGNPMNFNEGPNNNAAPVAVLFSPGGAVHSVIRNDGDIATPASLEKVVQAPSDGTIYLLVGRRERTGEAAVDTSGTPVGDPLLSTWLDPDSLWVSIAPQTGRVVTEENRLPEEEFTALDASSWDYADFVTQRLDAREFARQSQGLGGR